MKKFCLFALLVCIPLSVYAQVKKITVKYPPVVTTGDLIKITYEIKEKIPGDAEVTFKETGKFREEEEPRFGYTYASVWENGKNIIEHITYYHCIFAVEEEEGEYSVPKMIIQTDEGVYESETPIIRVLAGATPDVADDDVLVRVVFEQDTIFDNEWVKAGIKFYSKDDLSQLTTFRPGAFDGFLIKEPASGTDVKIQRETYNGKVYRTYVVATYSLFPLHTGTISVESGTYELMTLRPQKIISASGENFNYGRQYQQYKVTSDPASVYVKPSGKKLLPSIGVDTSGVSISQDNFAFGSGPVPHQTLTYVLDYSSSMLAEDFQPNRQDAVVQTVLSAVQQSPGQLTGVIGFRQNGYFLSPLTTDHTAIRTALTEFQPADLPDGTAIGTSLALAIRAALAQPDKSHAILLFTDGVNNRGFVSPRTAGELAALFNIRIYTIGVADEGKARVPVKNADGEQKYVSVESEIDEVLLTEISRATGGDYFRAKNNKELRELTEQVRKEIFSSYAGSTAIPRNPSKISWENASAVLDAIYIMNKQEQ